MNRSFSPLLKAIIATILALLCTILSLIYYNRGVLKYGGEGLTLFNEGNSSTIIDKDRAHILMDMDDKGRYVNKLIFTINGADNYPTKINIDVATYPAENKTASCGEDGLVHTYYEDLNPIYVKEEVINIDKAGIKSITISALSNDKENPDIISINDFAFDNSFNFNPYIIFFSFAFFMALFVMLTNSSFLLAHKEWAFMLIALSLGLSLIFCLPKSPIGADDIEHLRGVSNSSLFPNESFHLSDAALNELLVTEFNNPDAVPESEEEMALYEETLKENVNVYDGEHEPDFHTMNSRKPAYLAMALGMKIARSLHLSWPMILSITRLSNLLMYVLLMFFAIKLTPIGKTLMMIIGLLPQNLFMAATISYDPYVTGFLMLGTAFMLRGRKYLIPMIICIALGSLPKAVYAAMMLMAFGFGMSGNKEIGEDVAAETDDRKISTKICDNIRRNKWIYLSILGASGIVMAYLILPKILNPAATGDLRGGDTNLSSQIAYILAYPLKFIKLLIYKMVTCFRQHFLGVEVTSFMGHVINDGYKFMGYKNAYTLLLLSPVILSYLGYFGLMKEKEPHVKTISIAGRIWIILVTIIINALIWTSMYIAFTPVGLDNINGVQGRYFIPLLFPFYLALSPIYEADKFAAYSGKIKDFVKGGFLARLIPICYYLIMCLSLILAAFTIYKSIIMSFCL